MEKILICMAFIASFASLGFAQDQSAVSGPAPGKAPRTGVLLLAHGGRVQEWNEEVHHVADRVDLSIPTEIALGMATKSAIQEAINRLVARGVTGIVAVPLFVSSHSSVIDSTAYLLGLRTQPPEDLAMFARMDHGGSTSHQGMAHDPSKMADAIKPVKSPVPIRMAAALDHHPIVAGILKDRAASISKNPSQEIVVLVAHGPVPKEENKLWLSDMNILADEVRRQTHYAGIECLTLRDDAEEPVRNAATQQLRKTVEQIDNAGRVALIVPLLLSYGGIENGIHQRLKGLAYEMPSQALLPDERIVNWVLETVKNN